MKIQSDKRSHGLRISEGKHARKTTGTLVILGGKVTLFRALVSAEKRSLDCNALQKAQKTEK